jgi:hypothetical protein
MLLSFIKGENACCSLEDHQFVEVLVVIHMGVYPVSKTN